MGARAAAVAAALLVASCETAPFDNVVIGVTRSASGDLVVRLSLCPGDVVERLTVTEPGQLGTGVDRPDVMLWRIVADPPAALSAVRVGDVPAGFTADVAWDAARRTPGRPLVASVRTTRHRWAGIVFDDADATAAGITAAVEPGRDDVLTEEGFRRNAGRVC